MKKKEKICEQKQRQGEVHNKSNVRNQNQKQTFARILKLIIIVTITMTKSL